MKRVARCPARPMRGFHFYKCNSCFILASKSNTMTGWIIFAVVALGGFVYFLLKYTKEPH
jgi:hypothetical protein